ncbi:MAG: EAL domain-containing protein [Gammaproteobacteria bacterium]|nr:EAL domain-containing protein [Gammaproteobacteria bacterium]
MTLGRQLFLIITLMFILVFAGTLIISVNNTRNYLVTQLESHAQDGATSLGLSISPYMVDEELIIMERMVDAIFDGGYYREIRVESVDGYVLIERVQKVRIEGVPQWFIDNLPLDTPVKEAMIMAGWKQGGRVVVHSHPGYAYDELWTNALETFWWSALSFLLAMVATLGVLQMILTPLRAVEAQAKAIANREFPILDRLPWTRELRRVVGAMNKMTTKVEQMFREQTELAEHLRQDAYTDSLTGTANRRSFLMRLDQMTSEGDETAQGGLIIVKIADLDVVNRESGFALGNEILESVTAGLRDTLENTHAHFLARVGGSAFGVLLFHVTAEQADEMGRMIAQTIGTIRVPDHEPVTCHVGVGYYTGRETRPEMLSQADMALRKAEQQGPNAWYGYQRGSDDVSVVVHGAEEWRTRITEIIRQRQLAVLYQPAQLFKDDGFFEYEALARFRDRDDQLVPAGVFLPMAERLGLTVALDTLVVELVLKELTKSKFSDLSINVNLSFPSLEDEAFISWLTEVLKGSPALGQRLILEVSENCALRDLGALAGMMIRLKPLGIRFSLDQFGVGSASFGYLRGLKPDFLKIDGSYIRNIQDDMDNQFFVSTLADIAHSLDIRILANFVENEQELKTVRALGMDGAQGYHVGRPQRIEG